MPRVHGTGLPQDAIQVAEIGSFWAVYYSEAEKRVFLYPTCYHTKAVGISKEGLQQLLGLIENWSDLKEKIQNGEIKIEEL